MTPARRPRQVLNLPNSLTLLRLAILPLILYFLLKDNLNWALRLLLVAGLTDSLDGLLARRLRQKTQVGMYLDPVADKLLLSSCFLVLAWNGRVPWLVSGLVLARDAAIIVVVVLLLLTTEIRRFPPTALGKANTAVQVAAVFAVLLEAVYGSAWLHHGRTILLLLTPLLVVGSSLQYALLIARRVRKRPSPLPAATR